ncbi:MAG: ABC transporter ATP-binding protein [Gemmatimonadota bacterium]|nr:ABC transporter ATP-binding protein [Gemmatimonadota bacterium]MDH3366561.1 ABC transporter ATP-binding protein [Gemmatimonadota bacterium]MDH3479138.1 ABC transporter ATP-binding protein [Gemmatimonadota bacterium]MDH3569944.1 ABC transporter ATP-binding protein [Gemmatimonadota bacterium]MDH5548869.1 ABC transporter ATP-binding protein [Gemmatimonadota bacterium]
MKPLLEVRDLRTTFAGNPATRAVDGVNFTLDVGETLAIVGESGCGKTVTALSILGLIDEPGRIEPESVVEFGGVNLLTLEARELRRIRGAEIAMVFQEPATSLNPVLTVETQITETLRAHRTISRTAARARATDLLELVRIPQAAERLGAYPHELSGGMQQRVMIAIALSCEPKVLIADEPTTALDVTVQAQILELLAELQGRLGMAMLLISHDLGVVAGLADRIAVMYGGQIIEQASAAAIFERPMHPYTEALLKAVPRLDRPVTRLSAIAGSVPNAATWPDGCRFHPRCPHAWDRCRTSHPELTPTAAGDVRCWLTDEPHRRVR